MWSGFSSEIETVPLTYCYTRKSEVACGAASHLRLKHLLLCRCSNLIPRRMWSGFSSEIETCVTGSAQVDTHTCRMWSGFSSEIETPLWLVLLSTRLCRMWSGFSSEIETKQCQCCNSKVEKSHVERLLI